MTQDVTSRICLERMACLNQNRLQALESRASETEDDR